MAKQVSITKTPYREAGNSVRTTYTVTAAQEMTPAIFVIHVGVFNPVTGDTASEFSHVMHVNEETVVPIDGVLSGESYYRTNTFTRTFDNQADADEFWTDLKSAIVRLIQSLTVAETVLMTESEVLTKDS